MRAWKSGSPPATSRAHHDGDGWYHALKKRDFIYSLNRLNVAVTRARAKSIVFLPRPLLEPPIQALDSDRAADGIVSMQGLANWCERRGHAFRVQLDGGALTVLRGS